MLADLTHKWLLGSVKGTRNRRPTAVLPPGWRGDALAMLSSGPPGPGERLLTLQLASGGQGALGLIRVP